MSYASPRPPIKIRGATSFLRPPVKRWTMTASDFYYWVLRLAGFSICMQSIENIVISQSPRFQEIWSAKTIGEELNKPALLFSQHLFIPAQISLFFLCFFGFLLNPELTPTYFAPIVLGLIFLTSGRFRGTLNGGSDYITTSTLIGISLPYFIKDQEYAHRCVLIYVGAMSSISYFVAGLAKIGQRPWWNGTAAQRFFAGHSLFSKLPTTLLIVMSISVIIWESLFFVIYIKPNLALPFLAIAFIFHFIVFVTHRLNRFIWAWFATFPAIYWCSQAFH